MSHFNQTFITLIIDRYNLELDEYLLDTIVVAWLQKYDRDWIVKAIVESIHRGRYKVKSVDNILSGWHRIGKPAYKFTAEFEREILQSLPVIPTPNEDRATEISSFPEPELPVTSPAFINFNSDDLNPEESAPFQHHNYSTAPTLSHRNQPEPIVGGNGNYNSVILQLKSLASLQHRSYFDPAAVDAVPSLTEVVTNRIVSQPAKSQLFQTLKAIVEPSNFHTSEASNLDSSPSYTDSHLPSIANFEFSLGNASGE
jgi:hypothetical protein